MNKFLSLKNQLGHSPYSYSKYAQFSLERGVEARFAATPKALPSQGRENPSQQAPTNRVGAEASQKQADVSASCQNLPKSEDLQCFNCINMEMMQMKRVNEQRSKQAEESKAQKEYLAKIEEVFKKQESVRMDKLRKKQEFLTALKEQIIQHQQEKQKQKQQRVQEEQRKNQQLLQEITVISEFEKSLKNAIRSELKTELTHQIQAKAQPTSTRNKEVSPATQARHQTSGDMVIQKIYENQDKVQQTIPLSNAHAHTLPCGHFSLSRPPLLFCHTGARAA